MAHIWHSDLNTDTYREFALYYYDKNKFLIESEFESDFHQIICLKKTIQKDPYNIRPILNYLIKLFNVFQNDGCVQLLFFKIDRSCWGVLKTYLIFLNFVDYKDERFSELETDPTLMSKLESI
jgi:hypothetical protein